MKRIQQIAFRKSIHKSALALFVVAGALFCVQSASSQMLTTLYNFQGPPSDGSWPCAGVVLDATGNLYGTTQFGGQDDDGTTFKLDTNGMETLLHSFTAGTDGENPCDPLAIGPRNELFGTALYGGYNGNGTVFVIQNDKFKAAYDFPGGSDGSFPDGLQYSNGALYGTTAQGGNAQCAGGCGTIFKLDRFGHQTVLYSFHGSDGRGPGAGVIRDEKGNLYGTTNFGGQNNLCPPYGCGTVFKLDPLNKLTVLHSFTGGANDGWFVVTGVVQDSKGNLFGTTSGGGTWNMGTIYEITNGGEEKVLYNFSGPPDGATPNQLFLAPNDMLYGTTYSGGDATQCVGLGGGCGTIFMADKLGHERVLYRFSGITDGAQPTGPVVFDSEGNMYGTTQSGVEGACPFEPHYGCGTVWKLELGGTN